MNTGRLSLRVRVVEQELPADHRSFDSCDPTYQAIRAIYNPSCPAGPPLVESFFTKLVRGEKSHSGKMKSGRREVHLRDEVKVCLPDVLDRRHFLQFSLFSIQADADVDVLVAETTVPFIISSKEAVSGGRVTTVIPNGLHRIQLDEGLRIHVETRLASSSHASDPGVAVLLRDYPTVLSASETDLNPTSSNGDIIVHAPSGVPFLDILSRAPGPAVRRYFPLLMAAFTTNLANRPCPSFYLELIMPDTPAGSYSAWHRLVAWEKTDGLIATVRGLFEILDKTETSYWERDRSSFSLQYRRLIKSFVDVFDEALVAQRRLNAQAHDAEHNNSVTERQLSDSIDSSHASNGIHDSSTLYDDPSSVNDSRDDPRARAPKYQITSPRSDLNPKSFSRKAFVATRSEQMKAEAELNNEDEYGRDYFDDDETVMTFGTTVMTFGTIQESKSFHSIPENPSSTLEIQDEASSDWTCGSGIIRTPTRASRTRSPPGRAGNSTPFSFASKRAEYMANRVNSVAQLVMAPCMSPAVDEITLGEGNGSGSPRRSANGSQGKGKIRASIVNKGRSGNQNPFEPSSDVEEEGDTKSIPPYLRGNQSCLMKIPPISLSVYSCDQNMNGDHQEKSNAHHLYEIIMALWVCSWTSLAASMNSEAQVGGSSNTVPTWPYELVQGVNNPSGDAVVAFAFARHLSFFLPMCLKSLGLRCAEVDTTRLALPMTFLDDNHMKILVPFVETMALGLMREAMSGSKGHANSDQMLAKALFNNDCVLDFFIALFALLHPSQVATLIIAYFHLLTSAEDPTVTGQNAHEKVAESYLRRVKCSRQIRLHAVERLAAMPAFARFNFPPKFTGAYPRKKVSPSSWSNQNMGNGRREEDGLQKFWDEVDRFPQSFWLSELLMNQCLLICTSSCDMIIMEAKKQARASRNGRSVNNALIREDLLRMESLAFHAVLCAYELLIKRQAMNSRFQTISSSTRLAALFTRPVLQHSVIAVSRLARMDPNQKVRVIWLLSLLYILQEGPDALIRDELRKFCNPGDNRISNFVQLLKLASATCQHFVPCDGSLSVLGDLSKEMTQETFNCLSATAILLIDECYSAVSEDEYALFQLGKSMFDLLLHLLATPQSSVTLLRTLGASAHALDKFGVLIFLKSATGELEHWGRLVLTMMNSMELSVRSMAVDFLVSLLSLIYQEQGCIDSISLCLLSVLPEAIARQIALFSLSGLINSMEDVESSVWPLRRSLADVEETNPLDDDRIDPQLLPPLTTLCRTGQAIIDGVLVEMRLRGSSLDLGEIVKAQRSFPTSFHQLQSLPPKTLFDADEESVLEAASFFTPESSLTQKLRWLFTLRDLHVTKKQWSEVAEALVLCAHSLLKSLDHISNMWRPSPFNLWNDTDCSPWLLSIGSSNGQSRGHIAVTEFANAFSDPGVFAQKKEGGGNPRHISVECVCTTLVSVIDQIEVAYSEEDGMEEIAFSHFEELLEMTCAAMNDAKSRHHGESARIALRRVRTNICSKLAKPTEHELDKCLGLNRTDVGGYQIYVRAILHGNKPQRFKESTTIPTFFEWDMPSICRISKSSLTDAARMKQQSSSLSWEECICQTFAKPLIAALTIDDAKHSILLRTRESQAEAIDETKSYISVMIVQKKSPSKCRKFFVRHSHDTITEYTVAHKFPHVLSRQRSLITSEIKASK